MANFINLIVTNGGSNAGEGGWTSTPELDGDHLINVDKITFVEADPGSGALDVHRILIRTSENQTYTFIVSTARTGDATGAANRPSLEWLFAGRKAINTAITNSGPGGKRTNVQLPKDGDNKVYFRTVSYSAGS